MIQLKDVSISKNNQYLLKDINLNIEEEKIYLLEGLGIENLKALYGLLEGRLLPSEGDYLYHGRSLHRFSKLERASLRKKTIINLFDTAFYNNNLTVLKNLQQQLKNSGHYPTKWKGLINETLKELSMESLRDKKGQELTPLQLIKGKIARALVVDPKLILMGDIFLGLLEEETEALVNIFTVLKTRGVSVINAEAIETKLREEFIKISFDFKYN